MPDSILCMVLSELEAVQYVTTTCMPAALQLHRLGLMSKRILGLVCMTYCGPGQDATPAVELLSITARQNQAHQSAPNEN